MSNEQVWYTEGMKFLSPAKINLTLRVSGVRPDGFHALDSVVVPLSLVDEIELEKCVPLERSASEERSRFDALTRDGSGRTIAVDGDVQYPNGLPCEGALLGEVGQAGDVRHPNGLPRAGALPDGVEDLCSRLEVISETVDLSSMPEDVEKNLAMRALRLLEREVGRELPTRIVIRKHIPLGGGLGGGSSNAATVLRGVNALWELGLSTERLCALGAELGSDVAQFVLDGLVRMRGRGEQVERLDGSGMEPMWLVLANDGTHCSTPAVYRAFDQLAMSNEQLAMDGAFDQLAMSNEQLAMDDAEDGTGDAHQRQLAMSNEQLAMDNAGGGRLEGGLPHAGCAARLSANGQASKLPSLQTSNLTNGGEICDTLCLSLQKGEVEAVASVVMNDLEEPCYGLFPEVKRTAEALRGAGCMGVTLCGSGATVFGLVRSREEGEVALAHPALSRCWRACVQTLPDGVMAAHGPLTPIVMVRIHVGQP